MWVGRRGGESPGGRGDGRKEKGPKRRGAEEDPPPVRGGVGMNGGIVGPPPPPERDPPPGCPREGCPPRRKGVRNGVRKRG